MKELDHTEQVSIFNALNSLDTTQKTTKDGAVVMVMGKFGPSRLQLVHNLRVLQKSLRAFEENRKAMLRELWPEAPVDQNVDIAISDFPEGVFDKWKTNLTEATQLKSEIDLKTLPRSRVYSDENDFPAAVLAILEDFDLLSD